LNEQTTTKANRLKIKTPVTLTGLCFWQIKSDRDRINSKSSLPPMNIKNEMGMKTMARNLQ
jgi:hypothetical protein